MPETFGKTDKGNTEEGRMPDAIHVCKFTSGSAGELASISVYIKYHTNDVNVKCAIYDSNKEFVTNGDTEEKLLTSGQDGWVTFNFGASKPSVAATTVYYLAWWFNQDTYCYNDVGAANQYAGDLEVYNSWPAGPLTLIGHASVEYSIFATYYEVPPAKKTLVQAALISIAPLIVLPTLAEILRLTGGY